MNAENATEMLASTMQRPAVIVIQLVLDLLAMTRSDYIIVDPEMIRCIYLVICLLI